MPIFRKSQKLRTKDDDKGYRCPKWILYPANLDLNVHDEALEQNLVDEPPSLGGTGQR